MANYDFKVAKGYDLSKLDQDLVKEAQGGKGWNYQDQARYDKLAKAKGKAQSHQSNNNNSNSSNSGGSTGATGNPENAVDQTTTGHSDSTPSNEQTQNVNQDNDINSTVTGNNNTVINEQDNSIRQYGGDNRSFTYNGSGNPYTDTPVSAATMSGYYDVDDSPAAQAKRFDMWSTMNRDAQKRYAGDAMKTFAKYGNTDARSYTDESMENALNKGVQYSFDRADRQTGHVFGDIWNKDYITEEWKMPSAPAKIESEAGDIADEAMSKIEDM